MVASWLSTVSLDEYIYVYLHIFVHKVIVGTNKTPRLHYTIHNFHGAIGYDEQWDKVDVKRHCTIPFFHGTIGWDGQ